MAEIKDIKESWEGHLKGEVEDFLKKYLGRVNSFETDKAARIGIKNMTAFLFASAEDKQEWRDNGVENWIDSEPIIVVGTERNILITNVSGNNNPYFYDSIKQSRDYGVV